VCNSRERESFSIQKREEEEKEGGGGGILTFKSLWQVCECDFERERDFYAKLLLQPKKKHAIKYL